MEQWQRLLLEIEKRGYGSTSYEGRYDAMHLIIRGATIHIEINIGKEGSDVQVVYPEGAGRPKYLGNTEQLVKFAPRSKESNWLVDYVARFLWETPCTKKLEATLTAFLQEN